MPERVGFISTRFAGTDGVSLESAKWAQILWDDRHVSYWYAGQLDRHPDISLCIPESYFNHPENAWLNERIWGSTHRTPLVSRRIRDMAEYLKDTIYQFVSQFDLTMLVYQNVLTIPMHIPLGIACTEFMEETRIPAIAHHHDFFWERTRFLVNSVSDYLDMAFPPRNRDIQHVVINQTAQEELSWRKGVPSTLIPNVLDFENPPPPIDSYSSDVRSEIGLEPDDIMILQPTRIVPRKGIEHAVKLLERLGDPRCKLVVSHEAGDEGMEYQDMLGELAHDAGVDIRFISTRVSEYRQLDLDGKKMYTLSDLYPHADLVSYPSLYEGFGNAFLESIYYGVPMLVNRYAIFARDIEPLGFRVAMMDGMVTRRVVEEVRHILRDREYRREISEHNYAVARRFFSYAVLRRYLRTVITNLSGLS
jgi:mannosylglucosylglycerate synthase